MTCNQVKGDEIKGFAVADNEVDARAFAEEKRELGLRVRFRRKYETFLGERMQVSPPLIKIYFEP